MEVGDDTDEDVTDPFFMQCPRTGRRCQKFLGGQTLIGRPLGQVVPQPVDQILEHRYVHRAQKSNIVAMVVIKHSRHSGSQFRRDDITPHMVSTTIALRMAKDAVRGPERLAIALREWLA